MENDQNPVTVPMPSVLTNYSDSSGPCFGAGDSAASSTADFASASSPFDITANTPRTVRTHTPSTEDGPSSSTGYVTLIPTSAASAHKQSVLPTTEPRSPFAHQFSNIQDPAPDSPKALSSISPVLDPRKNSHSSKDATELDHFSSHALNIDPEPHSAHIATEVPNSTEKCTVESPLPLLPPYMPLEYGSSIFVEHSAQMSRSQTLQQHQMSNLPSSATSDKALVLSLVSIPATVSAIHGLPTTETMRLTEDRYNSNDTVTCPLLEPQSIESPQVPTFPNPLLENDPSSPPPAPRPALMMLPNSEPESDVDATEALTSMHNLLSSLSQNQIAGPAESEIDEEIHEVLPSSSPSHNILTSSSPPDSSLPQLFSSSPSGPSTANLVSTFTARQSPPAFLHHRHHSDTTYVEHCEGVESPPEHQILSEESETVSPLLFAQSDNQETNGLMSLNPLSDGFTLDSSDEPDSASFYVLMVYHIALPVTSSPISLSSPRIGVSSSPTSSPHVHSPTTAFSSPSRKRKRDCEEEGSRSLPGSPIKPSTRTLPAPKRSTIAAQQRQHKKLATPFKSPLITNRPNTRPLEKASNGPPLIPVKGSFTMDTLETGHFHASTTPPSRMSELRKKRVSATARAAAQFKSPLSSIGATDLSSSLAQVRLTPTIQALERKIQTLKRALKVKKDNEEEVLADLTSRWTEAGREVALEVWELVKECNDPSCGSTLGGKRSFNDSWGWEVQGDEKRAKSEESWDWSVTDCEETNNYAMLQDKNSRLKMEDEDGQRTEYTLGMMLRSLGIDPVTLGWVEQEGIFKEP